MPHVTFEGLRPGMEYGRPDLAARWGYQSYHALARGVVTPRLQNIIVLFVTGKKQPEQEQYEDRLEGDLLFWEGPTDHFAEKRMISAGRSEDEIHVFYRSRHHEAFTYLGEARVEDYDLQVAKPSGFRFRIIGRT